MEEEEESPEECKVCVTPYDRAKRRPRTLPCGHTFCSLCLTGMIKEGSLACPSCRNHHLATTLDAFPISYDMEAILRKLKVLQCKAESTETPTVVREREEGVRSLVTRLQATLAELERYEAQLQDWLGEHRDILTKLKEMVEKNLAAVRLLQDERGILLYQRTKGEEMLKSLEATKESLLAALSPGEAVSAADETEQQCGESEDWMDHCQAIFPDHTTAHTSLTVRQVSSRALEMVGWGGGDSAPTHPTTDTPAPFTIMEKVNAIAPVLSVEGLRREEGPVRRLLEEGHVVATESSSLPPRLAHLSSSRGLLHLHALAPRSATPAPPTPTPVHTIQHDLLTQLLDPSSTLVFLTLQWPGREADSVYIRLSPDTELGRQFLLLCTGQRGPSYAASHPLGVWNKGTEFEMVGGGDYERNDGQGGAPIMENLRPRKEYQRAAVAGTVRAMHGPLSNKSAQFSISTRDCPNREWHWAFGHVESGLEVVKAAAAHKDIKEVEVVDCGVVVPL